MKEKDIYIGQKVGYRDNDNNLYVTCVESLEVIEHNGNNITVANLKDGNVVNIKKLLGVVNVE